MDIDQKAILEVSVSVYSAFGKENRASIPDTVLNGWTRCPSMKYIVRRCRPNPPSFAMLWARSTLKVESRLPTPSATRIVGSAGTRPSRW